jgi:aspartate oxidase
MTTFDEVIIDIPEVVERPVPVLDHKIGRPKTFTEEEFKQRAKERNALYRKEHREEIQMKRTAKKAIWRLEKKLYKIMERLKKWDEENPKSKLSIIHYDPDNPQQNVPGEEEDKLCSD